MNPNASVPLPPPPIHAKRDPLKPASWIARLSIIATSVLILVVSCALPAVYFREPNPGYWPGISLLILGIFGLFFGAFGWVANLFWGLSLLLVILRRWVLGAVSAAIGFALALTSYQLLVLEIPLDEGGVNKGHPTGLGPGFYLWAANFAFLVVGCIVARVIQRNERARQAGQPRA